jgi:hypothetical protein
MRQGYPELLGKTIGKLTVVEFAGVKNSRSMYLCKCECGNVREYIGKNLAYKLSKSCGCVGRTVLIKRNTTHGSSRTPEYRSFYHAKGRCQNPGDKRYLDYGGRGIEFKFASFEDFYRELGTRPKGNTLDRIDNNKHYERGNVKWSTPKEQSSNRRKRSVQRLHEDLLLAYAKQVMGEY